MNFVCREHFSISSKKKWRERNSTKIHLKSCGELLSTLAIERLGISLEIRFRASCIHCKVRVNITFLILIKNSENINEVNVHYPENNRQAKAGRRSHRYQGEINGNDNS